MGFSVETDANAAQALAEAHSGGNGKFPPLLKGEYQATIVPLKKDARVDVSPWGGDGPNKSKQVVRVAAQILEGSPLGAKRQMRFRVPLFTRFAPTQKNPQGAPARMYFDFWGALGVSDEDLIAGRLPDVDFIMGKQIGLVLGDPLEPTEYDELGYNEVNFVNKPGDGKNSPRRQPGQILAPWLDAEDNLILTYPFATPDAQAFVQKLMGGGVAPQQQYVDAPNPSFPGQVVPSFGQQAPSFAGGQAAPGGNVTPGPWAGQAANPALQQAAAAGTSF